MGHRLKQLLVATNNAGKLEELRAMLSELPIELISLADLSDFDEVEETGSTFDENAKLKASGYARQSGLYALADDSGLEVAALGDRPGVLSARYGSAEMSFADKMRLLLTEIAATGDRLRLAQFVCSIAIADPSGEVIFASEGICRGRIAPETHGNHGFGYDPLFIPDGYDQTFGELSEEQKRRISHRFRAFEQIMPFLRDFIDN